LQSPKRLCYSSKNVCIMCVCLVLDSHMCNCGCVHSCTCAGCAGSLWGVDALHNVKELQKPLSQQ
jgi:hypothetical protein